jgi:hypothetical protein
MSLSAIDLQIHPQPLALRTSLLVRLNATQPLAHLRSNLLRLLFISMSAQQAQQAT